MTVPAMTITRRATGDRMPADRDDDPIEFTRTPPHDIAAERAVIGACLTHPAAIDACSAHISSVDFYDPRHGQLWNALRALHAAGAPVDPIAVLDELRRRKEIKAGHLDGVYLAELLTGVYTASAAPYHAGILRRLSRQRRAITVGTRIIQIAERADIDNADLDAAYTEALQQLEDIAPTAGGLVTVDDLEAFFAELTEEPDWLIPGLLEHGDRVILTGEEGAGKSHLGRQVAMQAVCGIHPFTGASMTPARVLLVDLENPAGILRRQLNPLRVQAGAALDPERFRIVSRTEGIDLTSTADRDFLAAAVDDARPDLLITGPIYKMADGDPNEEKSAKPVALFLDYLRAATGTAIWLEAHVGNETSGSRVRNKRPFGWSGWRRWPEFGIHLDRDGALSHWRGAREVRDWPTALQRGGPWPFTPASDEKELRWQKIRAVREEFGEYMSIRDIADATGIHRSTVSRLIGGKGTYASEWEMLNGPEQPPIAGLDEENSA